MKIILGGKKMGKHLHIGAQKGDIAKTVLLPGDPLRAKFIAENYLENAVKYTDVRGMYGYTGTYKGKRVSVQGTGMGMPSISIYINELITEFDVENLVRIGSCGSISNKVQIRDIILATGASTTSGINLNRFGGLSYAPTADFELLKKAHDLGTEKKVSLKVGSVLTSDLFYDDMMHNDINRWAEYGTLAVEMETAELYTTAAKHGVRALAILTVSDHILTGEQTTADERQETFTEMMEIALELA